MQNTLQFFSQFSPMQLLWLEWSALFIGTLGTIMWSLNKNQLVVSMLWLASSLLWIVFAQANGHHGLTARDTLGVIMYMVGIWTYKKSQKKPLENRDSPEK